MPAALQPARQHPDVERPVATRRDQEGGKGLALYREVVLRIRIILHDPEDLSPLELYYILVVHYGHARFLVTTVGL